MSTVGTPTPRSITYDQYSGMVTNLETPLEVTRPACTDVNLRLMHAAIGCGSEAGELLDHIKKVFFAGRPIDFANIKEECGDILWYVQLALNIIGSTIPEALTGNFGKLKLRHGDKLNLEVSGDYSKRDLKSERAFLEYDLHKPVALIEHHRPESIEPTDPTKGFGEDITRIPSDETERLVPRQAHNHD